MKCFRWAIQGLARTLREERNMRIHLCVTFYVTVAGVITKLSPGQWCAVLAFFGLVMGLECVNTALETLCDKVSIAQDPLIGAAKDTAAGGVLVAAVCAGMGGCILFLSDGRPAPALAFARENPAAVGILLLTLPPWIVFIVRRTGKT